MSYTYHISLNGSDYTQVYPKEGIQATKEAETGCIFHREKISEVTLLKVNNATLFASLEAYYVDDTKFNDQLEFEIYSGTRTGTAYFYGLFSISDCKQDHERNIISFTPRVNDDYSDIMELADISYESATSSNILEQLRMGYATTVTLADSWTEVVAFTTLTATGGTITTATGAVGGSSATHPLTSVALDDIIVLDVTAKTGSVSCTFDIVKTGNTSITDDGPVTFDAVKKMGFVIKEVDADPMIMFTSAEGATTNMSFNARKIEDAYSIDSAGEDLMTFVENFLDSSTHMNLSAYTGAVKSTFFNNDALPSDAPSTIDTWIGAHSAGNYVTEVEASNELNSTIIGLLRRWSGITVGSSFKLSFNDVMEQLKDVFQVYWYIDDDDEFRLEHIKYFEKMVDDSTSITMTSLSSYKPEAGRLTTTYRKEQIVSREQFAWAQGQNEDFIGNDIIYDNFETSDNTTDHTVNNITTDIKYVIDNISDASTGGMGLYYAKILTGITGDDLYEIIISNGELSSTDISNAAFSWANLHKNYWTWKRMSENATVNGSAATLDSAIRFLEHDGLRFYYATAITWYTKITTSLGTGEIISAVRDFDGNFVTLKIGYNPYE